jgi:hypothetical protein
LVTWVRFDELRREGCGRKFDEADLRSERDCVIIAGRPFECTSIGATRTVWPMLVFTRYASASHWTKLIVRFRDYFANDRSLAVFCVTYERLPPQAGVRVT